MVFELKTWTLSFRDRLEKQHVRRCHLCNFPPCTFRFASNVGFSPFQFGYQQAGGARDDHWTGTNEDASDSSVISRGDALLTYLPI